MIKVAILSYPMLFQRKGGLQIQILETIRELKILGVEASLFNSNNDRLENYDLIHVFSAINGNYRMIEAAKDVAKPVVISPLVRPDWTKYTGIRARFFERIVGRLSGWHVHTIFQELNTSLHLSDAIIALGNVEKKSITEAFLISPEKINVIPNGIPQRFFDADPEMFSSYLSIDEGFILCVAAINPHKNQLSLIRALKDTSYKIVLIGQCLATDKKYLSEILSYPNVLYLGSMDYDSPLLSSAYAAADLFCLPSYSEVMPLSVLESLAAGTPVVMTKHHSMDLKSMTQVIREITPNNSNDICKSLNELQALNCSVGDCKKSVKDFSWQNVAESILAVYQSLL